MEIELTGITRAEAAEALAAYFETTPQRSYEKMEKFQECVRRIRQAGGKVNDSCGMHVHVDASNHNRQSLKNLLSIMSVSYTHLIHEVKERMCKWFF